MQHAEPMDDVRLRIRLPKKLADKINQLAEREGTTISRILERILWDYFTK